jgi:hypothetical protein
MWKTFFYWISLSSEFFRFIFWFLCQLIQSSAMKRFLHDCIRDEKTSWRWRLSFTTWMSFFMREILRFSCETCLFSHYYSWNRSFRSITNRDRILCEILSEIHRKRSSFMNEKCCKQWLMNAIMSRKQNENETLNNSRFQRLLFSFVFVQAFSVIHSFIFFFQIIFKNFWSFSLA